MLPKLSPVPALVVSQQPTSPNQYSAVEVQKLKLFSKHTSATHAGSYTAEGLVMLFSSWVSGGPSLTVTGTVLSVDPTCPVELGSLTDEDCLRPNPPILAIRHT